MGIKDHTLLVNRLGLRSELGTDLVLGILHACECVAPATDPQTSLCPRSRPTMRRIWSSTGVGLWRAGSIGTLVRMGLLNGRNLRRAKELLEKNRHKVGDAVGKATVQIDKVSGGKTTNLSKKAEDAARKYSAGSSSTHHGAHPDAVSGDYSSMSKEEAELRRAEAQAKAANAMAGLANAANGFLAKAQARVDKAEGKMPPPPADSTATNNPPPMDAPPPMPSS